MDKILELREKRAKAWEAAKAFLDSKRGADGLLAAEDVKRREGLIALLVLTRDVMETCIDLLGFEAPEKM